MVKCLSLFQFLYKADGEGFSVVYLLLLCVKYYIPERKNLRIFEDPSYMCQRLFQIE